MPDGSAPGPEVPRGLPKTGSPQEAPSSGRQMQPCLGRVVAIDGEGRPRVRFHGCPAQPPLAQTIGAVTSQQLEDARAEGRVILLGFLGGCTDTPVIMSLSSMAELGPAPTPPEARDPLEMELEVDGEATAKHLIEASEELVLRCGQAAITLRADGTVRVTGRDITSWARRRHRIRGGSVAIN